MVKEGIDALSRPELGVPHNFPPHQKWIFKNKNKKWKTVEFLLTVLLTIIHNLSKTFTLYSKN